MKEHNCRVCGLYIEELPWGEDGSCPTYEICPCCGVEFGNEDYTLESIRRYREKWINGDCKWFLPKEKPLAWDFKKQFQNVSKKYL